MNNHLTETNSSQLIKELRFTRIVCLISSVLTLCLLVCGILLFGRVHRIVAVCEPVVEKLTAIDVERLNSTMDYVNASLAEVDWEQVAEALGELDVEALNSAIEGLDTKELTEALANLNTAAEKLKELGDKLSRWIK